MLLSRVCDRAVGGERGGELERASQQLPGLNEDEEDDQAAATASVPAMIQMGRQQADTGWPPIPGARATLRIPGFAKAGMDGSHGEPTSQKPGSRGKLKREEIW